MATDMIYSTVGDGNITDVTETDSKDVRTLAMSYLIFKIGE